MPEQMLRYRAASFFGRVYAPELLMGLRSAEEEQDRIIDVTPDKVVTTYHDAVTRQAPLRAWRDHGHDLLQACQDHALGTVGAQEAA